jgi:tetratricopeptide (TPR) repeat protein
MKQLQLLVFLVLIVSCSEQPTRQITNASDYDAYLISSEKTTYQNAFDEKEFWSKRLSEDTTGVGNLGPLAGAYEKLFATTGDASFLYSAEKLHKKGRSNSANSKDGYTRALAHNYITQHRFQEAKELLEDSYAGISNKKATAFMLFDVYMELGEYEKADSFLGMIKNNADYNYLIRLAKWSDYQGNLNAAIKYIEKARDIAESRDSKSLKIWTYSNIADFYGHSGRLEEAYTYYLKTLELEPDNAFAKKGIAWIIYSEEKSTVEANRILDSIMVHHNVPDYFLLKSQMASFDGNSSKATHFDDLFLKAVSVGNYGNMYNGYVIEIYAETNPTLSLQMAKQEVVNRSNPESYRLLALAQLANDDKEKALYTIENYVIGQTFEPMAQYHSALVFKANGINEKVKSLKEELLSAGFELGPVLLEEIESW